MIHQPTNGTIEFLQHWLRHYARIAEPTAPKTAAIWSEAAKLLEMAKGEGLPRNRRESRELARKTRRGQKHHAKETAA